MAMTEPDGRRAALPPHNNRPGIGNYLSVRTEPKTEPLVKGVVGKPAGRVPEDASMTNDALIATLSANLKLEQTAGGSDPARYRPPTLGDVIP